MRQHHTVICGFLLILPLLADASFGAEVISKAEADRPALVRVYTHGEGQFAVLQDDGTLKGPTVDQLQCVMGQMAQPYSLDVVAMVRSHRLEEDGILDIWFPTYDAGDAEIGERLVGPIGHLPVYWFVRADRKLDPSTDSFRRDARVTAFPGSRPEKMLSQRGYNHIAGTDDENKLVLWLVEGRVDAVLAADFMDILQPGALALAEKLEKKLFVDLPVTFELMPKFHERYPAFAVSMQQALDKCLAQGPQGGP